VADGEFFTAGDGFGAGVHKRGHQCEVQTHHDSTKQPQLPTVETHGGVKNNHHKQGDVKHDVAGQVDKFVFGDSGQDDVENEAANHDQGTNLSEAFKREGQSGFVGG